MIFVENKRRKIERIKADYPKAIIIDVTSTSEDKQAKLLSPFYPHNNIPIPFSKGYTGSSVEGIWQGLKVFEGSGIDISTIKNNSMSGLKRSIRKYGKPIGHQKGINNTELLDYFNARMQIYIPTYLWVLENIPSVKEYLAKINHIAKEKDIVLLDYNTNTEFRDISSPISHAGLIKLYLENNYPKQDEVYAPMSKDEIEQMKKNKKKAKLNQKQNTPTQLSLF